MLDEIESVVSAMGDFNFYDWFIVVVWAISLGYGLVRGFAREALSILGWFSAFLAANVLVEAVANLMRGLIDDPTTRFLLGWILIFIAVLLMFGVIAAFLSKQMRQPGFHLGNRLLGGLFGWLRGVIIVAAISVLLRGALPDTDEDLLDSAVLMPPVDWVAEWVGANFDEVMQAQPAEAVKETIESTEML